MIKHIFHKVNQWVTRFVIYPGDDKETLLRKKIWLFMMACYVLFFSIDDLFSFSTGDIQFAIIDAVGIFLAIIVFIIFCFHRRNIDKFGLFLQITIIILPSIKCYLLGGIFHATGIEIIGLIGPIYALTFPYYRRAVFIFLFYLGVAIGGTFFSEYTDPQSEIFNSTFFYLMLMRFTGSVSLMFIISLIYNLQIAKLKIQEEERLKQLHTAKSKFYTNITHEFRTPLTIILGIADNIGDKMKDTLAKEVKMIKNNGGKLLRLVSQLLNLSKMEAGAMPVNMVQDDILPYIKYIVESFHSIAEGKSIQIHFLSSLDSVIMDYDPDIMEEIISNLLSNAIKFTSTGGNVYVQVEIRTTDEKGSAGTLFLNIRDTGAGIAEDKLPHIFDRFYQADDESTRKAEGTGIGLALVKEYINLIHGTIQVKSKPGKGTEFILLLPVTRIAPIQKIAYKDIKKKYGAII
jgi:signal transduction histidine kinase